MVLRARQLHINVFGSQAVGSSTIGDDFTYHAFRVAPHKKINPLTDDLGTLGGPNSEATSINDFGQVVGRADTTDETSSHAFIYADGVMRDLNDLISPDSSCELLQAADINDVGQIAANADCSGQAAPSC